MLQNLITVFQRSAQRDKAAAMSEYQALLGVGRDG